MPRKLTLYFACPTPRPMRFPLLVLARATLLEAWRGRIFLVWLTLALVVAGIAFFVGELATTEAERFRITWLAVGLRVIAVLLIAFFAAASIVRERDEKRMQFVLALALSRFQYLAGKLLGIVMVAAVFALFSGLMLKAFGGASLAWSVSLLMELLLLAALTLFAASAFGAIPQALSFALLGYFLARAWPGLIYLSEASVFLQDNRLLVMSAKGFGLLLPRLDLYTRTAWLFDAPATLALIGAQTAAYGALLLLASTLDFRRQDL